MTVLAYDSPAGIFKIHYTEQITSDGAVYGRDGNPATIPQYVIDLAAYLDTVWNEIITVRGYRAPPGDGTLGGDAKLDVYLVDMDAYGYTAYESSPSDVYMVLENDYEGFPANLDTDSRMGSLKATAGHEFFHVVHFQYATSTSDSWWMETSSTWMEDDLYPAAKEYLYQVGRRYNDANDNGRWDDGETYYWIDGVSVSGTTGRPARWFDRPEYSLDSTALTHEYGTVIWAEYLSKIYGAVVIKSIWERIGTGVTALQAISDELAARGTTLRSAFVAFQSPTTGATTRTGPTTLWCATKVRILRCRSRSATRWIISRRATTPSTRYGATAPSASPGPPAHPASPPDLSSSGHPEGMTSRMCHSTALPALLP